MYEKIKERITEAGHLQTRRELMTTLWEATDADDWLTDETANRVERAICRAMRTYGRVDIDPDDLSDISDLTEDRIVDVLDHVREFMVMNAALLELILDGKMTLLRIGDDRRDWMVVKVPAEQAARSSAAT